MDEEARWAKRRKDQIKVGLERLEKTVQTACDAIGEVKSQTIFVKVQSDRLRGTLSRIEL